MTSNIRLRVQAEKGCLAQEDYEHLKKFIELVETTIDVDEINKSHEIKIKPNFSESLLQISARIDQVKKLLEQQFDDAADDLGIDTGAKKNPLNFENHSIYGHCFRLTRKARSSRLMSDMRDT